MLGPQCFFEKGEHGGRDNCNIFGRVPPVCPAGKESEPVNGHTAAGVGVKLRRPGTKKASTTTHPGLTLTPGGKSRKTRTNKDRGDGGGGKNKKAGQTRGANPKRGRRDHTIQCSNTKKSNYGQWATTSKTGRCLVLKLGCKKSGHRDTGFSEKRPRDCHEARRRKAQAKTTRPT